jgi:hypothetical protein
MILHPFRREPLLVFPDGDEIRTITGLELETSDLDKEIASFYRPSYPIRYALVTQQRIALDALKKNGHINEEVLRAAAHLQTALHAVMDDIATPEPGEESHNYDVGAGTPFDVYEDYRHWVIFADPQAAYECLADRYVETLNAAMDSEKSWDWGDVYALKVLWCIDESTAFLDAEQPIKAGVWAAWAQRYSLYRVLYIERQATYKSGAAELNFSQQGLDARHAENRRIKATALELYRAKENWQSLADAARRIAPQVKRTELVVLGWIRDYRKKGMPSR